jgi:uncharacterized protein (TIGR02466 family)
MSITNWFPTKILCEDLDKRQKEKVNSEMMHVFSKMNMKPLTWSTGLHSVSTPDFNQNLAEEYEMHHIKTAVYETLQKYPEFVHEEALEKGYKITESWFTLTEAMQRTDRHSHGRYDLSGVYYVQTSGEDGSIKFTNEGPTAKNWYEDIRLNQCVFEPKEGRIILFPGWLPHQVSENKTFSKRISFAFNISFIR